MVVSAPPMPSGCQIYSGDQVMVAADAFFDPITHELMTDPVLAANGHVYDRASIERWLSQGRQTSPRTNQPLAHGYLLPAWSHRQLMASAQQLHAHLLPAAERGSPLILGLNIGGLPRDQIVEGGIYAGLSVDEAQICQRWDELCQSDDVDVLAQIERQLYSRIAWRRSLQFGLPLLALIVGIGVGVSLSPTTRRH